MLVLAAIDSPETGSLNDPLSLRIDGWLYAGARDADLEQIEIHAEGRLLGQTRMRFDRPDVRHRLNLPETALTGFSLLLSAPELFGVDQARFECRARYRDGISEIAATREIKLSRYDHRECHYGVLVDPTDQRLFHRNEIYTSGASQSQPSPQCLELLYRFLPRTGSVLDVGCGFGAYGGPLLAAGYQWLGVEVKPSDVAELARLGLPHRQVDGQHLPFADRAFDAAICIEVLEHVPEPAAFLTELRRVACQRVLFSVPNAELIPYLYRYAAVPWHLLEGDHKNFFTRANLRHLLQTHFRSVEVLSYGEHPLRTPEGLPLHYHLFAVAEI